MALNNLEQKIYRNPYFSHIFFFHCWCMWFKALNSHMFQYIHYLNCMYLRKFGTQQFSVYLMELQRRAILQECLTFNVLGVNYMSQRIRFRKRGSHLQGNACLILVLSINRYHITSWLHTSVWGCSLSCVNAVDFSSDNYSFL